VKSFIGWYKGGAFAARLPLSALEAVASHDNILSVNAVIRPTTQHTRLRGDHVSRLLEKLNEAMAAVTGTSLNDQAYIPMGMAIARQICPWGSLDAGRGVTVGIISDSFNSQGGYLTDAERGYLPGPASPFGLFALVENIDDLPEGEGSDEGRAIAQLVHAFVPHSRLCFATGAYSVVDFASNIEQLASRPGPCVADIIVDDVMYAEEEYFEDGLLAQAMDRMAAKVVLYFSAAGNSHGHFVETEIKPMFRSDGRLPDALKALDHYIWWNEFGIAGAPNPFLFPIQTSTATDFVCIQWNDDSTHVHLDLDLFILDTEFHIVDHSRSWNDATNSPFETVFVPRPGAFYVAVGAYITSPAELVRPYKLVLYDIHSPLPVAATERSIWGHPAANGAITVAAYHYANASLEPYSSHGPVAIHFGPSGAFSLPKVRQKPDIAGVDCTDTSFFGRVDHDDSGLPIFCGTSAAAAHVAGVSAFLYQLANREMDVFRLREVFAKTSRSSAWSHESGFGLINALQAAKHMGKC